MNTCKRSAGRDGALRRSPLRLAPSPCVRGRRSAPSLPSLFFWGLVIGFWGFWAAVRGRAAETSAPPSFRKDIAPVLVQKCLTCHDREKAKGGYRMDTFAGILGGGKSKTPAIVAGEPMRSRLYELV